MSKDKKFSGINKIFKSETLQKFIDMMHDGTIKEFVDDWKWIFSFSKRYKKIVVFYTFLGLFGATLSLVVSYVSKELINIIVGKEVDKLWILILYFAFSTIFSLVVNALISRIGAKFSIYVNNDIQKSIFRRMLDADWESLSKYQNGDLLNRFSNDVGTVANNAIGWIPNVIVNIYSFVITFVVLYRIDHIMAWIAVVSAPILLVISRYFMKMLRNYKRKVLEMNSKMMSFETETFYNIDTIKAFGAFDHSTNELETWQQEYKKYNLDYNAFEIKANVVMTLISSAVGALAFGYCLYRLWSGQILYGDMTFFLTERNELSGRFSALVSTIPGMVTSAISAHRIREIVELPKEKHNAASLEKMSAYKDGGLTIEIDNLSYSYDNEKEIYKNCNFRAIPGEIVAVLGPSGEGKTTLIRIILGMVKPQNGSVRLVANDGAFEEMNADLRQLVSYVPQGNTLISGTIASNMRLVKEDATDAEIEEALKIACAYDFISNHPQGIYGKVGEKGKGLSEGQAQRIAIARAILKDAPILILDEATSALDLDTEERVLNNLMWQKPNKTVIVSTHRTSVLSLCQRIYTIEDKQIKEKGLE